MKHLPILQKFEWQPAVESKDQTSPPSAPSKGDRYIVAGGASGDWTGQDDNIAVYTTEWEFISKKEGTIAWVKSEQKYFYYNGTNWVELANDKEDSLDNPEQDDYILSSKADGTRSWVEMAGALDWKTISTNTNAEKSKGYLIDASSNSVTLTLPETPSEGDVIGIVDYTESVAINDVILARNGNKIHGEEEDLTIDISRAGFTLVYSGANRGWIISSEITGGGNNILNYMELGDWESKSNDTVYQAETDGIVIGYTGTSESKAMGGYTDSNASPATLRVYARGNRADGNFAVGITMPVKKGDYWKTTGNASAVYWIPIISGDSERIITKTDDKASQAEAEAGTDDEKYMTPLSTKQSIDENVSGIPSGGIIIWSGAISNIPTGWSLCDGTNGTPDLTDRFVIHADADSGGTNDVGDTGGSRTMSVAQMPSHTHTYTGVNLTKKVTTGYSTPEAGGYTTRTTNSTGSGDDFLPKYYALAYIMKD